MPCLVHMLVNNIFFQMPLRGNQPRSLPTRLPTFLEIFCSRWHMEYCFLLPSLLILYPDISTTFPLRLLSLGTYPYPFQIFLHKNNPPGIDSISTGLVSWLWYFAHLDIENPANKVNTVITTAEICSCFEEVGEQKSCAINHQRSYFQSTLSWGEVCPRPHLQILTIQSRSQD